MTKKVMILGANDLLLPLIRRSKEMEYHTIVVSPDKKEPGFLYADEAVHIDLRDKDAVLNAATRLRINGIITDQAETPIRTVAYVADKLGLPGIGTETAELFTNKYLQRKKCSELGINNIRYCCVDNFDSALSFFKELDCSAIIKPVDSAGSRGVALAHNIDDLYKYFEYSKTASRSGEVIMEEYIEGKELLLDGVVVNGKYQTIAVGEYHIHVDEGAFSSLLTKYPAEITDYQREQAHLFSKRIVEGFGLPWGRTHTELKISDNGIWLMETAARGGGRFLSSNAVPAITDFNSEEFLLKACLGEFPEGLKIRYNGRSCGYVAFYLPEGEVVSIEGLDDVLSLSYVTAGNLVDIKVGMHTNSFVDKTDAWFVHFWALNDEQFYDRLEKIKSKLKIGVKTDKGIDGIIWEL